MKYFVYELHLRTAPFHAEFCGYLIYNKTQECLSTIVKRPTMREARARCEVILHPALLNDDDIVVWRNWPIIVNNNYTEEDILKIIKEREIYWDT